MDEEVTGQPLDAMTFVKARPIPKEMNVVLGLVKENDPIYNAKLVPFNFGTDGDKAADIVDRMAYFCQKNKGMALAANQLGLPFRVFVIMVGDEYIPMFNPNIVSYSEEKQVYEEGCLTHPGLFLKIKRPVHIRVRFADETGEVKTIPFTGMSARVIQHEFDHLEGIDFKKRVNRFHMSKGLKQKKLITRRLKNGR